jgi:hypothetical protein
VLSVKMILDVDSGSKGEGGGVWSCVHIEAVRV